MNFFKKLIFPILTGAFLTISLVSCEDELTTIGSGIIGGETFSVNKDSFPVFAYNKKIKAVETNNLPIYQLGNFNDPVYGNTTAIIISQVQLSSVNPTFGANAQSKEDTDNTQENETITGVYLYIPYLTKEVDTDGDGVDDAFDRGPEDPNSDSDGDSLTDNQERLSGTDPLNADTDGDGTNDNEDDLTLGGRFPRKFNLDSIYIKEVKNPLGFKFNLKVDESTFFLRDLDPNANFEEAQEYFSDQEFSPSFFDNNINDSEVGSDEVTISNEEILFIVPEDDPETPDVDEEGTISSKLNPGIRIKLDSDFFQNKILAMEGNSELSSQAAFTNFFRGIRLSISDDVLLLLDLKQATITIDYEYVTADGTEDSRYQLSLISNIVSNGAIIGVSGNAVNTYMNDAYPTEITNSYSDTNASNIYLKGGAGSYAEIKLFDDDNTNGETIINQIKANNWIINEANLVFYIDRESIDAFDDNTESLREPLRLFLFDTETNLPLYSPQFDLQNTNNPLSSFPNYDGVLNKENTDEGVKYTIRITDRINDIIAGDIENVTLGLSVTSNINVFSSSNTMVMGENGDEEVLLPTMSSINPLGTILFGSADNVSEDKKLKLEILYTEVE